MTKFKVKVSKNDGMVTIFDGDAISIIIDNGETTTTIASSFEAGNGNFEISNGNFGE